MSEVQELVVEVAGRRLEVVVAGPAGHRALVFHLGTPSGAVAFPALVAAAAARGLPTITWSRPGYGTSTPSSGRSVADVAGDTDAVLAALGMGEFVTLGWSGGGPHALACAALLPERCRAAATLAGVAPATAEGLDWLAGMGPENLEEFGLARQGEQALTPWLQTQAEALRGVTGPELAAALGGLASEVDVRALDGELADVLAASFRRAVLTGVAGWRDDDLAFVRDWGFPLADVAAPVAVWQGGQDRMVPAAHGDWLAEHLPTARLHREPDEGHLSLVTVALDRVLDDLLEAAGLREG